VGRDAEVRQSRNQAPPRNRREVRRGDWACPNDWVCPHRRACRQLRRELSSAMSALGSPLKIAARCQNAPAGRRVACNTRRRSAERHRLLTGQPAGGCRRRPGICASMRHWATTPPTWAHVRALQWRRFVSMSSDYGCGEATIVRETARLATERSGQSARHGLSGRSCSPWSSFLFYEAINNAVVNLGGEDRLGVRVLEQHGRLRHRPRRYSVP